MARSPLPIVSPSTPTSGASRTSSAASGSFPAAGLSSEGSSGPWMIEEQSMRIEYWRVPQGHQKSFESSLSSLTYTTVFDGTRLAWIATLNYSKKKSYEAFDASAWQQTQLLDVLAVSADLNGTTYGNLTASTLGPVGSVITTRPYYKRALWDAAVDVTALDSAYASNFVVATGNASAWDPYVTGPGDSQAAFIGKQDIFAVSIYNDGYPFDPKPAQHIAIQPTQALYYLPGTYSTDQETLYGLIDWIDQVASWGTGFASPFGTHGGFSIPATLTTGGGGFEYDAYCASYDVTHHDWS